MLAYILYLTCMYCTKRPTLLDIIYEFIDFHMEYSHNQIRPITRLLAWLISQSIGNLSPLSVACKCHKKIRRAIYSAYGHCILIVHRMSQHSTKGPQSAQEHQKRAQHILPNTAHKTHIEHCISKEAKQKKIAGIR